MLGSLISAGASLLGGLFGKSSQKKQMEAQIDAQRQFAQNGIRWKVEDAQKAGVHPLYALGASTNSFSPIGIGGDPLAEGIANAGQDIGRAVAAKQTAPERAFSTQMQALQLQRGQLENQLLASQLARQNAPGQIQPPMPLAAGTRDGNLIPGQPATNGLPIAERFAGPQTPSPVVNDTMKRLVGPGGTQEPAAVADRGFSRTHTGGYAPMPSADANDRMEDQIIPSLAWALRNIVMPNLGGDKSAAANAPFAAPPGYRWIWSLSEQAYHLTPKSGKGARIHKLP